MANTVKQYKVDEVNSLVEKLKDKNNFILTNYSGIKVQLLNDLRRKIRAKGGEYKIVKNNLFKRALAEKGVTNIDDHLKGPIGVVFAGEDVSDLAKLLKDFNKEQENFTFSIGVIESTVYDESQLKKLADLPSKEVLLSKVMSLVNGPASNLAMGINTIMASLARGIQAVAEKNSE